MFYLHQEKEGFYISNDKTEGKFWPFVWAFCKNIEHWKILHTIDPNKYTAYKFALWFSENRVFILEENGNIEILTFKK